MKIFYNPDFLEYKKIFSTEELKKLEDFSNEIDFDNWFLTQRNVEDFSIGFSYNSAKLEGNSYSYIEAETLLKSRTTSENKTIDDANMLLNMNNAFSYLVSTALDKENLPFSKEADLKPVLCSKRTKNLVMIIHLIYN